MIIFDLQCEFEHIFEVWFDDTASYDRQLKKKLILCPFCQSYKITKSIMSPNISSKSSNSVKIKEKSLSKYEKLIDKTKKNIISKYKYVGNKFPSEARKMHYGDKSLEPIYGEASEKEAKDLHEEGLNLIKLPWSNDKNKKN